MHSYAGGEPEKHLCFRSGSVLHAVTCANCTNMDEQKRKMSHDCAPCWRLGTTCSSLSNGFQASKRTKKQKPKESMDRVRDKEMDLGPNQPQPTTTKRSSGLAIVCPPLQWCQRLTDKEKSPIGGKVSSRHCRPCSLILLVSSKWFNNCPVAPARDRRPQARLEGVQLQLSEVVPRPR